MPKHSGKKEKKETLLFKQIPWSRLTYQLISNFGLSTLNFKRSDWSRSRSRNQKRRAYDVVRTAFRFCLRLRSLRSANDLAKTRLSESEAEAEELNRSKSVGTCIVICLSLRFCFRKSGFHYNISGT